MKHVCYVRSPINGELCAFRVPDDVDISDPAQVKHVLEGVRAEVAATGPAMILVDNSTEGDSDDDRTA